LELVKPLSRGLLGAIESLIEIVNQGRLTLFKALRLLHINVFSKKPIKKGIVDIQL
jgi:hypothetical protein